jgi:hypothetical protein
MVVKRSYIKGHSFPYRLYYLQNQYFEIFSALLVPFMVRMFYLSNMPVLFMVKKFNCTYYFFLTIKSTDRFDQKKNLTIKSQPSVLWIRGNFCTYSLLVADSINWQRWHRHCSSPQSQFRSSWFWGITKLSTNQKYNSLLKILMKVKTERNTHSNSPK